MIILGFDPGIAIVGFGVIEVTGSRIRPVQYGAIQTKANLGTAIRLQQIYDSAIEIIESYQPVAVSIEKLFFNQNITSAMSVSEAREYYYFPQQRTHYRSLNIHHCRLNRL